MKNTFFILAASLLMGSAAANAAFITVGSATENRIQTDTRWTRDNVYILSRVIFVTNGANLTIEPGTIVRAVTAGVTGLSGIAAEPGSLVIGRGSKLIANGTVEDPIIFTSIDDPNVPGGQSTIPSTWKNALGQTRVIKGNTRHGSLQKNNYTPNGGSGDNGFSKAARWGGVILCGRGYVSQTTGSTDGDSDGYWDSHVVIDPNDASLSTKGQGRGTGADYVEGLATESGSTVLNSSLAIYGGTLDNDSSGVMRFCSLRYGGFVIGLGNEINGLTVCASGAGTTLEHIEVFQNADDGFEWFGGKHNTRFLFSLSNHDDSFDGDEGYRGTNQFWTAAQGTLDLSGAGLRSGFASNGTVGQEVTNVAEYGYLNPLEWDGGEGNDADRLPQTICNIYNLTCIVGNTTNKGFLPKLEAQLGVYNCIIENCNKVSELTLSGAGAFNAAMTWNNVRSFSTGATGATELGNLSGLTGSATFVEETATNTAIVGDVYKAIYKKNGLDLRLGATAPARVNEGAATPPAGFVPVSFAGSMRDNNMLAGWSVLEKLQVLPATNVARPEISMDINGTDNPIVNFISAGATLKYVVEKSTDQVTWTYLTVLTAPAGAVSHIDTTTTLSSGPVFYRVFAL